MRILALILMNPLIIVEILVIVGIPVQILEAVEVLVGERTPGAFRGVKKWVDSLVLSEAPDRKNVKGAVV